MKKSICFYALKERQKETRCDTEFAYLEPDRTGNAPCCPACGGCIGSLTSLPPYNIELELWDTGYGDIAFGPGNHILVSERFKILWEEHGLTGLDGFALVSVKELIKHVRFEASPPEYYLTSVVQSEAAIDQIQSGFEWESGEEPKCDHCRLGGIKRWKRIVLEPNTWSGENIFRPRGLSGTIMVDQRFKEFVDQFKITNCCLIPAEEYAHDFYPWEKEEA